MLDEATLRLGRRKINVLFSGIRPHHDRVLTALGALVRNVQGGSSVKRRKPSPTLEASTGAGDP